MICYQCPRMCGVNRAESRGFCDSPPEFRLARAALHYWEEPCISGKNGSGTVFFSGCNLKCVFCQNHEISLENKGTPVSDEKLIEIFERLIESGANNINLVNPTHYALRIADVLSKWKCPVPVVYNSGGYENVSVLKSLEGLVDIYLPDFKYIRADKAQRYGRAKNYPEIAKAAIAEMVCQQPKCEFNGDIMQKGVIIRHLILPQNTNSAIEIIDYAAKNFPRAYLSLMAQYTPCGDLSSCAEINRKITKREYEKVVSHAIDMGLENIFVQERDSACKEFIPPFDFTGVL